MAANKTLACGEDHPTTGVGCEEDLVVNPTPVLNPFGSY